MFLVAFDGNHCYVKNLPNSGTRFYTYNHFVSNVGGYGKQTDGRAFHNTMLFHLMESERLNIPPVDNLPGTEIIYKRHGQAK